MDLNTITAYRRPASRTELALAPGERLLGGGTWLFSEPAPDDTGLVDLTALDWPAWELTEAGLRIGATCTIAELTRIPAHPAWPADWSAGALFTPCAQALLASFKIWHLATVGGNVCRSFAAGSMISLAVALDGTALVWRPDGTDLVVAVAHLITGNGTNALGAGDVLRAIDLPAAALTARTAFRKIALAHLGRSGAVLTGRVDLDGRAVFGITAATLRPVVLRYPVLPSADVLRADARAAEGYYTDPLGSADWRRGVSAVLLNEIRDELA